MSLGGSGVSIGGFRILRVGCFGYITPRPEINECHLKRDQDSKGKDGLPTSIFQGICCPTGIQSPCQKMIGVYNHRNETQGI